MRYAPCSAFAVACLLALGSLAPADVATQPTDDQLQERVDEHYQRGMRAYENGKYEKAVTELRTVYSLKPDAIILYNIALAEWKSGDLEAAAIAAHRAEREGLPRRAVPKNAARLAGFHVLTETRRVASEFDASRTSRATPRGFESPAGSGASNPSRTRTGALSSRGWVGVGSAAVGLGLLGGALYIDRSIAEDLEPYERAARQGDLDRYRRLRRQRRSDLKARQTTGRVLLVAGTVALATGTGFLIWDLSDSESAGRGARVRALVTGPEATLSVQF